MATHQDLAQTKQKHGGSKAHGRNVAMTTGIILIRSKATAAPTPADCAEVRKGCCSRGTGDPHERAALPHAHQHGADWGGPWKTKGQGRGTRPPRQHLRQGNNKLARRQKRNSLAEVHAQGTRHSTERHNKAPTKTAAITQSSPLYGPPTVGPRKTPQNHTNP